jgi:tRNA A37 threonylcarbamoyladenosine dehydratase
MLHAFSRLELLLGEEALQKLSESRIAIFGIGGVGSFAAEGLARAGVGKFLLVDDDCVCITNINRQIIATRKTVGKPKVEVMRDRILDINPKAEVEIRQMFYMPDNVQGIFDSHFDYIIDAIDTVTAKLDLVAKAKENNIPIICSMGTGNKLDPTRLEITDISKTSVDPLARVVRKELRDRGITTLKVIYSKEPPMKTLETKQSSCRESCVCPKGSTRSCTVRNHIPGSTSFVPPVAGLIIAGEVVKDLTGIRNP